MGRVFCQTRKARSCLHYISQYFNVGAWQGEPQQDVYEDVYVTPPSSEHGATGGLCAHLGVLVTVAHLSPNAPAEMRTRVLLLTHRVEGARARWGRWGAWLRSVWGRADPPSAEPHALDGGVVGRVPREPFTITGEIRVPRPARARARSPKRLAARSACHPSPACPARRRAAARATSGRNASWYVDKRNGE